MEIALGILDKRNYLYYFQKKKKKKKKEEQVTYKE